MTFSISSSVENDIKQSQHLHLWLNYSRSTHYTVVYYHYTQLAVMLTCVCPLMSLERLLSGKHSVADVAADAAGWGLPLAYQLPDSVSSWTASADTILTAGICSVYIGSMNTKRTHFPINKTATISRSKASFVRWVQNVFIFLWSNNILKYMSLAQYILIQSDTSFVTYIYACYKETLSAQQFYRWFVFDTM